jgi:UDP-N-acetylmuramoyl-L-alanyl-D-glutamate--2,6-diaminopimelate ligase
MLLSELLTSAGLQAEVVGGDVEVADVRFHPRDCSAGSCFVAMRGPRHDGHDHVREAVTAGASAVVCQRLCEGLSSDGRAVACAVVPDSRDALGKLAQAIHDWPARKMRCIAVTGTNGKTTTAYMIRAILRRAHIDAGLLGTIAYQAGGQSTPAATTTPDPVALAELMTEMVAAGQTHLVMEVSSHALDQNRTAGVDFDVAVFTNLSGDHLDYHGDMESYLRAKLRLFERLPDESVAVVNRDEPAFARVAGACAGRVTSYALDSPADVRGEIERADAHGSTFHVRAGGQRVEVFTSVIGRHNVYNCLAAAGAAIAVGVPLRTVASALGELPPVPGRLERVGADDGRAVFVDYAHTDDALANVLSALRPLAEGRLVVVFGCGGERDATKRPRMGAVAGSLADRLFVTSDNPRSEDGGAIIRDILSGLDAGGLAKATVEPDRRRAIETAIRQSAPGDVVLIAGKGHEKYQIVGDARVPFDDVEAAREALGAARVNA